MSRPIRAPKPLRNREAGVYHRLGGVQRGVDPCFQVALVSQESHDSNDHHHSQLAQAPFEGPCAILTFAAFSRISGSLVGRCCWSTAPSSIPFTASQPLPHHVNLRSHLKIRDISLIEMKTIFRVWRKNEGSLLFHKN